MYADRDNHFMQSNNISGESKNGRDLGTFVQNVHSGTARLPKLMRFGRKPFPIGDIVNSGAVILSITLSPFLILGPIRNLKHSNIPGNYK